MAEFVPYTQRETYQLHNIPKAHLRNIGRRAVKKNMSYADVAAQAMAYQCGIPFVPSQRRRPQVGRESTSLSVRVPVDVMECIRLAADEERITIRSVMLNMLSDEFGLKRPSVTHVSGKRPGRKKEK